MTSSDFTFDDPFALERQDHPRKSRSNGSNGTASTAESSRSGQPRDRERSHRSSRSSEGKSSRSSSSREKPVMMDSNPSFEAFTEEPVARPAQPSAASAGRVRRSRRASIATGGSGLRDTPAAAASDPEPQPDTDYGYGEQEQQQQQQDDVAPAPRVRRGRRSSMFGDGAGIRATRSCESLSEMQRPPSRAPLTRSSSDISVDSSTSGETPAPSGRPVRRGRRASMFGNAASNLQVQSAHATSFPSEEVVDYGYGDAAAPTSAGFADFGASNDDYGYGFAAPASDDVDYGYGDEPPEPTPKTNDDFQRTRSQNQRKLLEDFKNGVTLDGGSNTSQRHLGAIKATANIMLPMAAPEKPQRRGRRASLIGAVGALTGQKKEESLKPKQVETHYDPSKDRERATSLIDRVGSSTTRRADQLATSANYSDRILSKSR